MDPQITLLKSRAEVTPPMTEGGRRLKSFKSFNKLFQALKLRSTDHPTNNAPSHDLQVPEAVVGLRRQQTAQSPSLGELSKNAVMTPQSKKETGEILKYRQDTGQDEDPPRLVRYETLDTLVQDSNGDDEQELLDQAASFIPTSQDVPSHLPNLTRPVVIPRVGKGATAPLFRAWPPDLATQAISKQDFITFIDNLNILSQPPAHAVALRIAAIGIAFVPFDGADGLSTATELAADALARHTIRVRCQEFLKRTNDEYFHPRNLHARLVNSKTMRRVVNIPDDDALVAPLAEHTLTMSPRERCLQQLEKYSCELSEDVPDPAPQTKVLQRIAAWNVRKQNRYFDKVAVKARKRAWKKFRKGKKLKREGGLEKKRVERLQWLVIQDLGEFEDQQRKMEGLRRRMSTWETIRSKAGG
ncbi:hypothetical protein VFPPC_04667 [Pochonia chlamydosporia 170]|uniref:Uncharacterized protein n=1 Tax=Pochonia chlamydosporia 170 TaxID=1380566 RepID=A0A179FTT6_METCM|nr:hypothetical protein VFPPC_04667 [Pochonia chlamydosporia 170]OAQ68429.1 hypothetical protein VFPPC_04667 [Pochonia chlamydosporia 170]